MTPSQRILVNTIAQYIRTTIILILSLYTTRIVLDILGQSDYGLYSLVAGIVAMLSFITNSLVATTQRFVSFYQGKGIIEKVSDIFNNCIVLHILLGIALTIILLLFLPYINNGFLVIPDDRVYVAKIVYLIVVIMLLVTFISSPFRALLTSHENIVYLSIIDVFDAILKVVLVVLMQYSDQDKLVLYSAIMLLIQFINFLALSIYCYCRYEECCFPNPFKIRMSILKEIFTFAGWKIYSTLCITGRQQGIAIILNRMYGTVINAAWGIGAQLSGYTQFLSSSVINAMLPQIVKSEGSGDRNRSIVLSSILSKITFFLISLIGIPFIIESDAILDFWLGNPPKYASFFVIMLTIALIIDSISIGLTHMNSAIGKIGLYSVVMATPKLVILPIIAVFIHLGYPLLCLAIIYLTTELACALIRVPMIARQAGFSSHDFFKDVIVLELIPAILAATICYLISIIINGRWDWIITFLLFFFYYSFLFLHLGLSRSEKALVNNVVLQIKEKIVSRKDY